MNDCPHYTIEGIRGHCALVDHFMYRNEVCTACRAHAGDRWPPTKEEHILTRRAAALPTIGGPRWVPLPILQHPDHCIHQERTINHQGCCESRTWFCSLHGVVDLVACRDCKDFQRDDPTVE